MTALVIPQAKHSMSRVNLKKHISIPVLSKKVEGKIHNTIGVAIKKSSHSIWRDFFLPFIYANIRKQKEEIDNSPLNIEKYFAIGYFTQTKLFTKLPAQIFK